MAQLGPLFSAPVFIGEQFVWDIEFRPIETGELTTPTAVTAETQVDGGEIETYVLGDDDELEEISEGVIRLAFPISVKGQWIVGVIGTGAAAGGIQGYFEARDLFVRE